MSPTGPCGEVLGSLDKLKGGLWVGTVNEAGHILEERFSGQKQEHMNNLT